MQKSLDDFLKDARRIHGTRYDYSIVDENGNMLDGRILLQ